MTEQVDMSQFIEAKSDQLNADDLMGGPRTITITRVSGTGSSDQPIAVHYEGGEGRPFKPCKTVRRLMMGAWGKEAAKYAGRSMTLYRDEKVAFGGLEVGGIRVSHMSHLEGKKTLALLVTKGRKASFTILPLETEQSAAPTQADALEAIENAAKGGMDALKAAWSQKWMAPFRDALQADLDRLKAAASDPAPDTNTNDVATAKADEIIAAVLAVDNVAAVDRIRAENKAHYDAFDDELKMKVDRECGNHLTALDAKAEAVQ